MLHRYKLMIPGPVEAEPEVLEEMGKPIKVHYGPEWTPYFYETIELMKKVMCAEKARLFLIPGPGTAALDAAIGNTIADGKKILVLTNGYFGNRFVQISKSYVKPELVRVVEAPMGGVIDPADVEQAFKKDKDIKVVALVHCETSTGVLNPVQAIAEICNRYGALLVVDAITSLGGVEFRFDEWDIGLCITSSQKNLGLFPGIAPIAISERAWKVIEKTDCPGWYLNFKTWQKYLDKWGHWHPHPVTMPTNLIQALRRSCESIMEEGLEARWERHAKVARIVRKGLENLGFELLAPQEIASPTITAAKTDARLSPKEIIAYLKEHHQILIAGGLDELEDKIIRVGHMGPTATPQMVLPMLYALEDALRAANAPVKPEQSLMGLEV